MIQLVILALVAFSRPGNSYHVTGINYHYGSKNGGTEIKITGSFSEDSFSQTDAAIGNKVYFFSGTTEYVCDVDNVATDENTIICETRAMVEDVYYVRVEVDGVNLPESSYCGGNQQSDSCSLKVVSWRTPTISSILPETSVPESTLNITGRIFTDKLRSADPEASNGLTATLTRVYVGGQECKLFEETDTPYGVTLDSYADTYSTWGTIECSVDGKFVSSQNVSFLVNEDYGRSKLDSAAMKVSSDYRLYSYQTYAPVDTISPNFGSVNGGAKITVMGNYFNDDSIEVKVGGAPCEISEKTDSVVKCISPSEDNFEFSDHYPGSRGIQVEAYPGLSDISLLDGVTYDDFGGTKLTYSHDEAKVENVFATSPVAIRFSGFFVPATSGTYLFRASKGNTDIYLSTDSTAAAKTAVVGPRILNKGEYYYYEVLHMEATASVDVSLNVYLEETLYNYHQTNMAKAERQLIVSSSPEVHEIQTVTLHNWNENLSPVDQELTLCVICKTGENCSGSEEFKFTLNGISTASILSGADEDVLEFWINALPTLGGVSVTVVKSDELGTCLSKYKITVPSLSGSLPLTTTPVSDEIEVNLTVSVAPVASNAKFSLAIDSVPSYQATVGNAYEIKNAVKSLFAPACPRSLDSSLGSAIIFLNFEGGGVNGIIAYSGHVTVEDSYCGSRSLKNPTWFSMSTAVITKITDVSRLCFAYKGLRGFTVRISFSYNTLLSGSFSDHYYYYVGEAGSSWTHECINLYMEISSLFSSDEYGFAVSEITITPESLDEDLFIDNVFFGSVYNSDDRLSGLREMRKIPSSDIKLEDVTVEIVDDVYSITMMAYECKTGIPLLQAAYGTNGGNGTFSEPSWGNGIVSIVRTQSAAPEVGGTFNVTLPFAGDEYGGTVSDIDWNIEADDLKLQLESLPGLRNLYITRSGTCRGYTYDVLFENPGGNHGQLTPNGSFSNPAAAITGSTITEGGLYLDPICGDWLRVSHTKPQAEVKINNVPSKCTSDCSFDVLASVTPMITSATVLSSVLTIDGSSFGATSDSNTVTVGSTVCTVTSASSTQITCTLEEVGSGTQAVKVQVDPSGYSNTFEVEIDVSATSIDPTSGSTMGGTLVTIAGSAFSHQTTVTIGGVTCKITSLAYNSIQCRTGPSTAGVQIVEVTSDGSSVTSFSFTYENPTASGSVSASVLDVSGGSITVTGTGFGAAGGDNVVYIGSEKANITTWTDTMITATAPSLGPGTYVVRVYIHPTGDADLSAGNEVNIVFSLDSVDPVSAVSSLMGGLDFTIGGQGFVDGTKVKTGDVEPEIFSTSATSISCRTGSFATKHYVRNTGTGVSGKGYAWEPETITIQTGDIIIWSWTQFAGLSQAAYQVFTTSSAASTAYDENGFYSGSQTSSGSFEYQFNIPGTYYYGGDANSDNKIFLRGVVIVEDPEPSPAMISVFYNNYVATTAAVLSIVFSPDATPIISIISPSSGTSEQTITITGTGFSTTPGDNEIFLEEVPCATITANETSLTCEIGDDSGLPAGYNHEVFVRVAGKGYSQSDIRNVAGRYFGLKPHISSITPSVGSTEGGTSIFIQGNGFTDVSTVAINGNKCSFESDSVDYSSITCITSGSTVGEFDVVVMIDANGFTMPAECEAASCKFAYSEAATVALTSVTPTTLAGNAALTIEWNGQDTDIVDAHVGSAICSVITVSATDIQCAIEGLPYGTYDIVVNVQGKGFAKHPVSGILTVNSSALFTTMTPSSGSILGSTKLSITGNGFGSEMAVTIGGQPCLDLNVVSTAEITCLTPSAEAGFKEVAVTSELVDFGQKSFEYSVGATPQVDAISAPTGAQGDTITLTISNANGYTTPPVVEIGGILCAISADSATSITCTLGSRYGGQADISVIYPDFGKATVADGVSFSYDFEVTYVDPNSGSLAGGQRIIVYGAGFFEFSTVMICDLPCEVSSSTASQIECVTTASSSGQTCDVIVRNSDDDSEILLSAFEFDPSLTPMVTTVEPLIGGTAGGTTLTITGTNLGGVTSVTIDGSECIIDTPSLNNTFFQCVTSEHEGATLAQVKVHSGTNGIADTSAEFYYIDRWSSTFTWGGESLPKEGDFIVISKDDTILLDTDTPVLSFLLIQGGTLMFQEGANVHLQSEHILITHGGLLQIGTEDEPYTGHAEITLHGHQRSAELPIFGAKTLGVREGSLEMHGKHVAHTWVLLHVTAAAGDTQIVLNADVDWEVGNAIVIASTGYRHSQEENEQHEISAIVKNGDGTTTITLTAPLKFEHLGRTENFIDNSGSSHSFDYRAEVGLLSRNIVFRGSDDPAWHTNISRCPDGFNTGMFSPQTCFQGRFGDEIGSDEFGASIMMHSSTPSTASSQMVVAHIEYVELTYVGQAFRLGRYPIHWHLMGNVTGNYVRGCSIHKAFNRAVTIHGTHNLLVERNVIYNIMGGAFFIEDGIETGNILQYNLAVFVKQSTSLLNDDITPAAYWVTNPDNIIQHNHAAGGTHFGYWYRMHEHPDGPSFDVSICQQKTELGIFFNNSAHSQGWFGLWIFQVYLPQEGPTCVFTRPKSAKFNSLTAWRCEKGAEWVEGGAIQFNNFKLSSHEDSGIDIKLIFGTEWDKGDRGAAIQNALIIGKADFEDSSKETKHGIILPFAPGLWIDGVNFFNFKKDNHHSAFFVTHITGTCSFLCGGFHYKTENLDFIKVDNRIHWRWEHEGVIDDLDGSFTGALAPRKVVPSSSIYNDSANECQESTDEFFSPVGAYPSMICLASVKFHRLAFNQIQPTSLEYKNALFTNEYGTTKIPYSKKRLTHGAGWMLILLGGKTYSWTFENGEQFTNLSYSAKFYSFLEGDSVIIKHQLYLKPDRIKLLDTDEELVDTVDLTSSSNNYAWHYDGDTREFSYKIGVPASSRKKRGSMNWLEMSGGGIKNYVVSPNLYRCWFTDCIAPVADGSLEDKNEIGEPAYNITILENITDCLLVQGEGDEMIVTIKPDCWIIWAVENVTVHRLNVNGNLFFSPEVPSITLTATYILVEGRFMAGWSVTDYHPGNLLIRLRGTPETERLRTEGGFMIGSKALACHGTCDLHGSVVAVSWSKLSKTAAAGSNELHLQESVDWNEGDEIVISPTGFDPHKTEKHMISSISSDGMTITLQDSLEYDHASDVKSYSGGWNVDMSAEVGLLTRSIKIEGEYYSDLMNDHFGARVLVTTTKTYAAKSRFSNVEFYRTAQEGYYDDYDPRFSIAFVSASEGCQIIDCSFHEGFGSAIGLFGTDRSQITGNVIHHTVNEGVVVKGSVHNLHSNLIILNLFRGSYGGRFESANFDYTAAINVESALNLNMTNNVVAGAERVAYRIKGQSCEETDMLWTGNIAHATLLGTTQLKVDLGSCALVNGFTIYNAWDFAIYHQTFDTVIIDNCAVLDSTVGYTPLVAGPPALSHQFVSKTATVRNSLFVARKDTSDWSVDIDESTNPSLLIRSIAGADKKAPSTPFSGRTAIMLALFASGYNGATFKLLHSNMDYPALYGLLVVQNVTFANYGESDGKRDLILYTNPEVEDIIHPTHISGVILENCNDKSKVFIDRPSERKINPSDCVDMQCDAKLKVLINDMDGSFLGQTGSIFSQAEYGWDGDPALGVGDYRIPKPMLTSLDGTRLNASEVVPNKGIARQKDFCTLNEDWQAYSCSGDGVYDYRMLIIESLDADTETRRLSPVALKIDDYIDLNNGPQDHGWCSGYTCQKRISTFYTIVPVGKHTELFFTSTPPQKMRFHLINSLPTDKITVSIWIPSPQKLDVYINDDEMISPTNLDETTGSLFKPPTTEPDLYKPSASICAIGDNYLDFDTRELYVCVGGGSPVTITTAATIAVSFQFPSVTVDDFFGEQIVTYLTALLKIPSDKVRYVNVVRESSKRRKRSDTTSMDIEVIADDQETAEEYGNLIIEDFQTGRMSDEGVNPAGVSVSSAQTSKQIAIQDARFANGETVERTSTVSVPEKISIITTPAGSELAELSTAPIVQVLDSSGNLVETLANSYHVTVTLDTSGFLADSSATLVGTETLLFTKGEATFSDLVISHSGIYNLNFTPTHDLHAVSVRVVVSERDVCAEITHLSTSSDLATEGEELGFQLQLTDCQSNNLQNIDHKGYSYSVAVTFDDDSLYPSSSLNGSTTFTFSAAGTLTTTGLLLTGTTNYHIYNLKFRLTSSPSNYDKVVGIEPVQVYPSDPADYIHSDTTNQQSLLLTFKELFADILGSLDVETLETGLHNSLVAQYPDIYFSPVTAIESTDGAMKLSTTITSKDTSAIHQFYKSFSSDGSLSFGTRTLTVADSCSIQVTGDCYSSSGTSAIPGLENTTIVFVVVAVCVFTSIAILATAYILKRHRASKVNISRNASPTSLDPMPDGQDNLSWSRTSTPTYMQTRMPPDASVP